MKAVRCSVLRTICSCVAVVLLGLPLTAEEKVEARGDKVGHQVHNGHFEKNNSGLKGDSSYLTVTDSDGFEKIFGVAAVGGRKFDWVPKDAFEKKMVVAVIKRGNAITEYKVEKVTADGETLYVQYAAETKGSGGTATFASPLIVTTDKGKIKNVVFLENGKKVGTVAIGKGS